MKEKMEYYVYPHPELLQVLAEIATRLTARYFGLKRCLMPFARYNFEDYCLVIQSINRQVKGGRFEMQNLSLSLIKMQSAKLLSIAERIDPDIDPEHFDTRAELFELHHKLIALYSSLLESNKIPEE
jgi:hypothetical protein